MTASDIIVALMQFFERREWLAFREFQFATGYNAGAQRRIDLFAMNIYPGKGMQTHAFEIKVDRTDFRRDIDNPNKHRFARLFSNQFWYVAPAGIIDPNDVPRWAGLMIATRLENGNVMFSPSSPEATVIRGNGGGIVAPWFDRPRPTWGLLASVARRAATTEEGE